MSAKSSLKSKLGKATKATLKAPWKLGLGFVAGFKYPFRGMRFVFWEHPRLANIWVVPILITLLAFISMTWAVWHWNDAVVNAIWASPTDESFWSDVARFVHGFVEILVAIVLTVVGAFVAVLLSNIVAAPFNDALSEAVEEIATGKKSPSFKLGKMLKDTGKTLVFEMLKIALWAAVMIPLWLLSMLIPVVGPVLYAIFGFLFTTCYFAIDYVDWPMARRGHGIRSRATLLRARFSSMFGFGTGVWIFLFLPIINLFFMPAAVAGGTLLYLQIEEEEEEEEKNQRASNGDIAENSASRESQA